MKILVYGSLNIDRTYSVPHFVRAGETLAADGMELFRGGKGFNQAISLARAGVSATVSPNLESSPATFTSNRTGITRLCFAASF